MKKMKSEHGISESLHIAVVQIPFIPVIFHPNENSIFEPDGGINNWWLGEEIQQGLNFNDDLFTENSYKTKIDDFFLKDYFKWLNSTVEQIFEHLLLEDCIDIVTFPEYFLPIELDEKLMKLLKDYSKNFCIVTGIGSVYCKDKDKQFNRFVIVQDEEIKFCRKVSPIALEKELGISEGDGPLIHILKLKRPGSDITNVPFIVLTCSDYLSMFKPGHPINDVVSKELKDISLTDKDISLIVIPSLSIKPLTFKKFSEIITGFGNYIVMYSNWSPFGGSCIWHSVLPKSNNPIESFNRNQSGFLICDIPIEIRKKSGSISQIKIKKSSETVFQIKSFKFSDESYNSDNDIRLETDSIYSQISKRLNIAIEICGICLKRCEYDPDQENEKEKKLINYLIKWKKLQIEISKRFFKNDPLYLNLSESDAIALCQIIENENIYHLVLTKLKDQIQNSKLQTYASELRTYVKDKCLIHPTDWECMDE